MKVSLDTLRAALKSKGVEAIVQKETNQLYFSFEKDGQQFGTFIRLLDGDHILQFMTFIPIQVQEKAIANTARFLHLANKELDLPGFCLDEASNTVFYRVVIPLLNSEMDDTLLYAYLHTSQDVCTTFCSLIQALGIGVMTMDEVVAHLKKREQQGI